MDKLVFERRASEAKSFWTGDRADRAQLTWDLLLEVLDKLELVDARLVILDGKIQQR